MHISFNMVTAGGSTSGVFSYVLKMAIDFPNHYPKTNFTLFITPDLFEYCNKNLPNVDIVVCKFASKSAIKRMLWEQLILPFEAKRRKIDLIYTFSVTDIFFALCPTVIRVGNMLPYSKEAMKYQTGIKSKFRLNYLRLILRLSVLTSDATLVMSKAAGDILINENSFPKNKIVGINRGVTLNSIMIDQSFRHNIPSEYILILSHIQEHKRLEEIIIGYSLKPRNIPLVFVGSYSNQAFFNKLKLLIDKLQLKDKVIFLGTVDRSNLYSLINPAKIIVFPSMVETYPSTLLEPMLVGSSMIVSSLGVMPALCGDSVLYYDPRSPDEFSEKLSNYLDSEKLRKNMKKLSKERMKIIDTSWEIAIEKRFNLFKRILHKSARFGKNK